MSTGPTDVRPAPRWAQRLGAFLAHGVWSTRVVGAANVPLDGPVLLAANHVGVIDGPILVGSVPRPTHVMVKQEMFSGPIGLILRRSGQIPVDRANGRSALAAALTVLKRGEAVGIFPEGNRGRGDAANAQAGVAWLAVSAGAPVIPVAVLGTRRTGESVRHVPGLRRRLHVEFGEPVRVERPPGVSGRAAIEHGNEVLREVLADHVRTVADRTGLALPTDGPERADRGPQGPVRR